MEIDNTPWQCELCGFVGKDEKKSFQSIQITELLRTKKENINESNYTYVTEKNKPHIIIQLRRMLYMITVL